MSKSTVRYSRLAPVYLLHEPTRRAVVNPFLAGRRGGWWDKVARDALVDDALVYVELEDEATKLRTFKIDLVDGLLQTPEYTAAVIRASVPTASADLVRRQVDARASRQSRLHGANPIQVKAILTEGALRVQVGGHETMRRQLEHLLRMADLPNVDVQVVPASGAYPAMGTPFYLLSFDSGFPDVGYVELLDKGMYLEEPSDVERFSVKFAGLRDMALNPEESREFIAALGAATTDDGS